MIVFFKKKEIEVDDYFYVLGNKKINLKYPAELFTAEYEKMTTLIRNYLHDEIDIWVAAKSATGDITSEIFLQFANIDVKNIAFAEMENYLTSMSNMDNQFFKPFSRFISMIESIYCVCDPEFLDSLMARFYKLNMEHLCYTKDVVIPSKNEWYAIYENYRWMWIIPHYQIIYTGDFELHTKLNGLYLQQ